MSKDHRRESPEPASTAVQRVVELTRDITEVLDVLEEVLSSDPDMPSHGGTVQRAEDLLAKHGRIT